MSPARVGLIGLSLLALFASATPALAGSITISPNGSSYFTYPQLLYSYPSPYYQTALKDGDQTYIATIVTHDAPIVNAVLDASAIGVPAPFSPPNSFAASPTQLILNTDALTVNSNGLTGVTNLTFSVTDSDGTTQTQTIPLTLDNIVPTISISSVVIASTTVSDLTPMRISGSIDGTGTQGRIFSAVVRAIDGNGQYIPGGYDMFGFNEFQALRDLRNGSFTNISVPLFVSYFSNFNTATKLQIEFLVKDEAGNIGTTTAFVAIPTASSSPCTVNCNSSVLFLPGIEGSRLYRPDYNGGTDKLWEPGGAGEDGNQDERDLFLTQNGSSVRSDVYARERDVIESTPTGDVYGPFIQKMDALKANGTIADWEPIAYDWRLSLDEILQSGNDIDGRIYYSGDNAGTSTPYIIQELHRLAATSKTGKVTIVAHSNGGLVTKRLTQILGPEASNLIDKIIFVAVPQAGTPQTVATGMHGYDQDFVGGLLITKATARTFASTSPMFFNLLPSAQYFSYVDDPVVTFDSSLPDWVARYGSSIHSQVLLDQFLTDSYGRVNSGDNSSTGVNQPIQITATTQISASNALHNALDAWIPPSGVKLIQIAGWGIPKTPTGVTYSKKGSGVVPELNTTIDGDGTVVVPSALWTSTATGVENYWFNLAAYNKNHPISAFSIFSFDHGKILATDSLLNFVYDVIAGSIKDVSNYKYLSSDAPVANENRLRYSLHSPLTLNLYDDQGHHTGVSTTTGYIEEQIPGTYYEELGDEKYLFVDSSVAGHIVMNGYASGTFTFDIDKFSGDTLSGSVSYTDVPTTPTTVVTTDINQDFSSITPLSIDQNGDGKTDAYVATDTGTLSLDQLLTNLTTAVQALVIKDKQKIQLLNKIAVIKSKIAKQIQKQTNMLAKLKVQISEKASKGKIDAVTANALSTTLDDLIAQEALLPIDSSLIQQLKDQINTANITSALKISLLNKVAKLENIVAINKSINSMSQLVQRKGTKAVLSDAETQNLLNLLDQIQVAI